MKFLTARLAPLFALLDKAAKHPIGVLAIRSGIAGVGYVLTTHATDIARVFTGTGVVVAPEQREAEQGMAYQAGYEAHRLEHTTIDASAVDVSPEAAAAIVDLMTSDAAARAPRPAVVDELTADATDPDSIREDTTP